MTLTLTLNKAQILNASRGWHSSVTASQMTGYSNVVKRLVRAYIKDCVEIPYSWPFVREITGTRCIPDNKVHRASMGATLDLSAQDGPHVGPMNLAIRDATLVRASNVEMGPCHDVIMASFAGYWSSSTANLHPRHKFHFVWAEIVLAVTTPYCNSERAGIQYSKTESVSAPLKPTPNAPINFEVNAVCMEMCGHDDVI